MKRSCVLAVAVVATACGRGAGDEFRNGLPTAEAVRVEFPASSSALTSEGVRRDGLEGDRAVFYGFTRAVTALCNGATVAVLGLVAAYLLGVVAQGVRRVLLRGNRFPGLKHFLDNVKAFVTLAVMAATLAAYVLDRTDLLPGVWREVTLALALFYFGSR